MDIVTLALAKKYANKKIAELAAVGFAPKIMDSLPTENINEHTLYLIPASDGISSNGYLEYIYINGTWECVGSTVIDFSMIGDLTQLATEDKATLVAAINEVLASSNTATNETKNYVNTKVNETTTYVNEQITQVNNNMEARVFQGNIANYNALTDAQKNAYDIAIVEPLAELAEEDLSLVDSIVGGEATETVIDMSEREILEVLDNIIGSEEV
jgi:3-phosphoglycerate kinase